MREIQFRIWDTLKKVMIYGGFQLWFDHRGDIKNVVPIDSYPLIEIMQYTDLKDKNGQKIYEGDIVRSGLTGNLGQVLFVAYAFRIKSITGQWGGELRMFENNHLEVIGNIYENPELVR